MSKHRKNINKKIDNSANNVNSNVENNTPLSTSELYDVMKFASEYYNYASGAKAVRFDQFDGAYTPYLTNERLSEIGLSPKQVTDKQLQSVLQAPISNQNTLIGYSEFVKLTDAVAKRSSNYLGNLPAFDYTFVCTNITSPEERNSEEYKSDEKIVKDFLNKFDVRGQFSYVNRRTVDIDAFYGVFRTDGENYQFQELPYNYCKITGKNLDWGYQFDFDMNWFLKMGLSFDQYPSIFKKMYDRVMTAKYGDKYDPSNPLNKRKGTFALWAQTSSLPDKGNFVCFKMNSDSYASIPFLTSLFQDAVNKPLVRNLQNNQYIIASQKILIGLIPLLKDQKSGQIKDALAVSPEVLGQFLGLLKKGLSDALKITGAPFEDVKQVEYELPDKNMYNEYNTSEAGSAGVTSRVIYSSDKMSATEVDKSCNVDEMIATSVYPQYARWLSSQVNYLTKKYKFKFIFEGTKYDSSKKERLETALKLADKGIVMPAKIAAPLGMNIFDMQELMAQTNSNDFKDLLYLLPNSNTKDFGSTQLNGRPTTNNPSDSTDRNLDRIIENKLDERS